MKAITGRFVAPPPPPTTTHAKYIYPWENTELYVLCQKLYTVAVKTGYTDTFDEFKAHFGAYLERYPLVPEDYLYDGEYRITPLPLVEQILQTSQTLLEQNIVVEPIPYAQTSNSAGGYTVIIG